MTPIPFELFTHAAALWLQSLPAASVDLVITTRHTSPSKSIGTTTRLTHSKASSNGWFIAEASAAARACEAGGPGPDLSVQACGRE